MTHTSKIITQLFEEAEKGNPTSQFKLAVELSKDKANADSIERSFRLFKQFAYAGNAEAQYILGRFYEGEYGEKYLDYMEAFKWYEKAMELGNTDAINAMQKLNQANIIKKKEALANQGDNKALYWMAYCCYHRRDYKRANEWLEKACRDEKRSHGVLSLRAYMYSEELGYGQRMNECGWCALDNYQKAAYKGNPEAQFILGEYWSYFGSMGFYNLRNSTPKYDKAYFYYLEAAKCGHKGAQVRLFYLYSKGLGVGQKYVEAFSWLYKAAYSVKSDTKVFFEGVPFLLAEYYTEKLVFSKPDYKEAMIWYSICEKLYGADPDVAKAITEVNEKLKPSERAAAEIIANQRLKLFNQQGALGPYNDDDLDQIIESMLNPNNAKVPVISLHDEEANEEESVDSASIEPSDKPVFKHIDKIMKGFDPTKIKITLIIDEPRKEKNPADFDFYMVSYGKFHDKKRVDVFQSTEFKIHPTERKLLIKLAYHNTQTDNVAKVQAMASIIKASKPTVITLYNRMINSIFPDCFSSVRSNMIDRREGNLKTQLSINKIWNIQNCNEFKELIKI